MKKDSRATDEADEEANEDQVAARDSADSASAESDSPSIISVAGDSPAGDSQDSPDSDTDLLRKIVVGTAGGVVTAAGVVMLVAPGPGIIVTLGGLSILGTEFPFARKTLNGIRKRLR